MLLDDVATASSLPLVRPGGLVLADAARVELARGERLCCGAAVHCGGPRLGNERVANIVALGALIAAADLCRWRLWTPRSRAETPPKFLDINVEALAAGHRLIMVPLDQVTTA